MKSFPFHVGFDRLSSGHRFSAVRISTCACALVACMMFVVANAQEARVLDNGPNHRVWQTIHNEVDASDSVARSTNSFVELSTGLNYWNKETSQYQESQESFEITSEGYAVAQKGPYRLIIAPNINEPGSVDLLTPDGKRFRSNPMGLSFRDVAGGQNILIAEVKDCEGQLVAPNVIVFPDVFDKIRGALKYTYSRHRFEQDVILYENPSPPPDLDPETTVIEMYTEFFDPPAPEKSPIEKADGWIDENLEFGAMKIGEGSAYVLNDDTLDSVETFKTWVQFPSDDGRSRQFLIESVPYVTVQQRSSWHHFRGKWGNSFMVDGDHDQALAAEPGFSGPAPSAAQVAVTGVIHGA